MLTCANPMWAVGPTGFMRAAASKALMTPADQLAEIGACQVFCPSKRGNILRKLIVLLSPGQSDQAAMVGLEIAVVGVTFDSSAKNLRCRP